MVRSIEHHRSHNEVADVILGGQDGLVNVLGVVLGITAATNESRIIIAGGLAATFAESISMAAVAYTSKVAERDTHIAQNQLPEHTIGEILQGSLVVGLSSLIGSLLPLFPFFVLPLHAAVPTSIVISILVLASIGAYKARVTVGKPLKSAVSMVLIGMGAALAGYLIGSLFN